MTNIQKFIMLLGKFYQKSNQTYDSLDEEIYLGGIEPIGIDRALEGLMIIARTKGLQRIPSVGEILEAVGYKEPTALDESQAIVGRIFKAAANIGAYRKSEAAEFIGERGWEAIQRFGGWDAFCMSEEDDFGTLRAQLRDMVKSVVAYDSVGRLHESPDETVKKAIAAASRGIEIIE